MRQLLTSLSPQDLAQSLATNALALLPQVVQPKFMQFSADYLRDNLHMLDALGYSQSKVTARYISFRDDADKSYFIPLLELRARGLRLNLVPGPRDAIPVWPAAPGKISLEVIVQNFSGSSLVWFAEQQPGWPLDGSLFSLLAGFSAAERKLMSHKDLRIDIDLLDEPERAWPEMEKMRTKALLYKQELQLPIIERNHGRLRDLWPEQLRLARVQVDGEFAAFCLWTEANKEAALVELFGNEIFRRDEVAPLVTFKLLGFLRTRELQRLWATRYEWFFPAIWSKLMDAAVSDADKLRHQQKSWAHLHQRGMRELVK